MRTNIPGLFSAGILNEGIFNQALASAAQGSIAANTSFEEIKNETKL